MTAFSGVWLVVYQVLLLSTWVGAVLFSLAYGLLMRWWRSEEGVHLFCYSLAVSDAMTLVSVRLVFGDFSGRAAVNMFCLVTLWGVVWWRLSLWIRTYYRNRPSQRALGLVSNGGSTRERRQPDESSS